MSELARAVERGGASLWAWLGPMTLATALVLVVALVADRLLERRVSAAARVWLLAAVLLRLALPAGWATPLGLLGGGAAGTVVVEEGPLSVVAGASGAAAGPGFGLWVGLGYLIVAAALLVRWGAARRALGMRLRGARPARAEIATLAPGVEVLEHEELGPLVAGLARPRIVVPAALASDPDALALVLRHERAHVLRRDHLLSATVQLVCALAWPLLPVWLAAMRVRALLELACDERALAEAGPGERRRYGEVLLALAEATPHGRLAGALTFRSPLHGRLRALAWRRRWPRGIQAVVLAALSGLALACASPSDAPAPAPPPPAPVIGESRARGGGGGMDQPAGEPRRDVIPGQAQVRGSLDKEIIRRVVRRHINEVRFCYELEARKNPPLAGRVSVQFTISPEGKVDRSALQSSTLGDPRVENCVVTAFRRWEFPKPAGGVVVVTYPFNFGPGLPPEVEPSPRELERPRMIDGLRIVDPDPASAGQIQAMVARETKAHQADFKACFEQALAAQPDLESDQMEVHLNISASGAVKAQVLPITPDTQGLRACIEAKAAAWQFPAPAGGAVEARFPFVFQGRR
jgi:TonB family protein